MRDVPAYLASRGLLPLRTFVDPRSSERPHVRDYARRNRNFKIILPGRDGLLLKQAMDPTSPELRDGILREARMLRAISSSRGLAALRPWTPHLRDADTRRAAFVTTLVHPATTLLRYHESGEPPKIARESVDMIARILAIVHEAPAPRWLTRAQPPIWSIPRGLHERAKVEPAAAWLLDSLEKAPFRSDMDDVRRSWRGHGAIVHTDPRFENFLLTHGQGPRGAPLNVCLVDWELARKGDPAWDVAYVVAECARFALVQRQDLEGVRDAARDFLRAYCASRGALGPRFPARVADMLPHTLSVIAYESLPLATSRPDIVREAMRMALDRPFATFGLDEVL